MNRQTHEDAFEILKAQLGMSDGDVLKAFANRMMNDDTVPKEMKDILKDSLDFSIAFSFFLKKK